MIVATWNNALVSRQKINGAPDHAVPAVGSDRFVCPHCSTFAVQTESNLLWIDDMGDEYTQIMGWAVHHCAACDEPILWRREGDLFKMIYPAAPTVGSTPNEDMPEDVRKLYEEAREVAGISRRSAAALIRLALQVLIDRLEPGAGNINTKIGRLVQRGLDPRVQEAMDVLRVVGNNSVHPGQIDVDDDPTLVPALFQLTNFVVERMISVPQQAQALFASLPQGARDAVSKRDTPEAGSGA